MSKDFNDILKSIQANGTPTGASNPKKGPAPQIPIGKTIIVNESLQDDYSPDTVNGLTPDDKNK